MADHFDKTRATQRARGSLGASDAAEVDAHARGCAACARLLEEAARAQKDETLSPLEEPTENEPASNTPSPSPSPSLAELRGATRVGRYLLLDPIGEGGMGRVFAAFDPQLGRKVAIKILRPQACDAATSARLLREAQAMAKLTHPNVVHVHDAGTFESGVFLAMELVEGGDLRHWLRERPRTRRDIVDIFLAAGRGLAAAHEARLVHRDFKPANILIGRDGVVRIADFGIARVVEDPSGKPESGALDSAGGADLLGLELTGAGHVLGTPGYMAPEQLKGRPASPRSDQFAFAVSLFQALFGARPFAGSSRQELLAAILSGELSLPPGARLPAWLRRILVRALAARPEDRYPSMPALLRDLARDPSSVRRRWATLALALTVLAGLGSGWLKVRSDQQKTCGRGAERLAGIWDQARKQALEQAMLKTGSRYAPAAFATVETALDRYTREWTVRGAAACEKALSAGRAGERMQLLRAGCLEARLREVAALTDILALPDQATVEKAARAAGALTPLAACDDAALLQQQGGLPTDPTLRAKVLAAEEALARVRLMAGAAQYGGALRALEPVREDALRLGQRSLQARAQYLLGEIKRAQGDRAGAEAALFDALTLSHASQDDATLATASGLLAFVVCYLGDRCAEGLRWAELAIASLERKGNAEEGLEAEVHSNVGATYYGAARYQEALAHQSRALELRRRALGEENFLTARSWINVGSTLNSLGRRADGLAATERGTRLSERILGLDHPDALQGRLNLATMLRSTGRTEEGTELARDVLERSIRARGEEHPGVATAHIVLAELLLDKGELSEARREAALAVHALEKSDANVADLGFALGTAGHIELAAGLAAAAVGPYARGVAILEKLWGPSSQDAAQYQAGWGRALLALGKSREARALLERAVSAPNKEQQLAWEAARARFALAQLIWSVPAERPRAQALAKEARDLFAATGLKRAEAAEVERWLSTRR